MKPGSGAKESGGARSIANDARRQTHGQQKIKKNLSKFVRLIAPSLRTIPVVLGLLGSIAPEDG
jgi:hypothetical protein